MSFFVVFEVTDVRTAAQGTDEYAARSTAPERMNGKTYVNTRGCAHVCIYMPLEVEWW